MKTFDDLSDVSKDVSFKPSQTNRNFHTTIFNYARMVHCVYRWVTVYKILPTYIVFLFLKFDFVIANSADPD